MLTGIRTYPVAINNLFQSQSSDYGRWLNRTAAAVEGEAAALVTNRMINVRTGRLHSSIARALVVEGGVLVAYVGTNVEYGRYLHEGTSTIEARPFLTTAMEGVV